MMKTGDHLSPPKNLLPLIDADWIVYMACQAIEYSMDNPKEADFQDIVDVLEGRVKEIQRVLGTTETPLFFFSGADNFRMDIATTKRYKANRKHDKPYNYKNLVRWIEARFATIKHDRMEADDGMSIWQTGWEENKPFDERQQCIIVTVDKDLRQVNGWHYSPEGYNFPSFGPVYVTDDNSYIELSANRMKVVGTGYMFFYSQLLTGDVVDNIPGLPYTGPVAAVKILANATTKGEAYEAVREAYRDVCYDPDVYLKEQADLLWMVRELDRGEPVLWQPPLR